MKQNMGTIDRGLRFFVIGPLAAWGAAAGAFGNKVFVAGGNFPAITTTQVFDIATSTWSTAP